MRISDWSSDVCSSDLHRQARPRRRQRQLAVAAEREQHDRQAEHQGDDAEDHRQVAGAHAHRRANAVVEGADKKPAADGGDDQAGEQVAAISTEHGKTSRSEEHTSELQSLMRISYAVFCLKKKKTQ